MATMQHTILVVDDEPEIREMLRFSLEGANFAVLEAEDCREAENHIVKRTPDLILLDWMLPNISGVKFAKQLKKNNLTKEIPIIILTAKAEEDNKIKGLETADDYVTKPFSPRELIARIRTVLRRGPVISPEGIVSVCGIEINTDAHKVTINNNHVDLSPIEYKLLYFFITHQDRVYTREQLLTYVWGGETYIDERTVDVQILRLRKVLSKNACPPLIHTIHGIGYKFVDKNGKN